MKQRSPLRGYNHNVRYAGRMYHVQTEDSGLANPHINTHLFHGGTILGSKRTDYRGDDDDALVVKQMQAQHKTMLKALKSGTFDARIEQVFGEPVVRDAAQDEAEPSHDEASAIAAGPITQEQPVVIPEAVRMGDGTTVIAPAVVLTDALIASVKRAEARGDRRTPSAVMAVASPEVAVEETTDPGLPIVTPEEGAELAAAVASLVAGSAPMVDEEPTGETALSSPTPPAQPAFFVDDTPTPPEGSRPQMTPQPVPMPELSEILDRLLPTPPGTSAPRLTPPGTMPVVTPLERPRWQPSLTPPPPHRSTGASTNLRAPPPVPSRAAPPSQLVGRTPLHRPGLATREPSAEGVVVARPAVVVTGRDTVTPPRPPRTTPLPMARPPRDRPPGTIFGESVAETNLDEAILAYLSDDDG